MPKYTYFLNNTFHPFHNYLFFIEKKKMPSICQQREYYLNIALHRTYTKNTNDLEQNGIPVQVYKYDKSSFLYYKLWSDV